MYTILYSFKLLFCTARTFGDPHLVSLDGYKYTFNGHGEFILVQSLDKYLNIQVRMTEAAINNDDSNQTLAGTGTVVSAVVAKHNESDTVQFELVDDELVALVNGDIVDFTELSEQQFKNLTVSYIGNGTMTATLSTGVTVTVRESSDILSSLAVTLSDDYFQNTQGLLGQYNGDDEDDLLPRDAYYNGTTISINSTLEEIHYQFGLTCKLKILK